MVEYGKMREELRDWNWEVEFRGMNTEEKWSRFSEKIREEVKKTRAVTEGAKNM